MIRIFAFLLLFPIMSTAARADDQPFEAAKKTLLAAADTAYGALTKGLPDKPDIVKNAIAAAKADLDATIKTQEAKLNAPAGQKKTGPTANPKDKDTKNNKTPAAPITLSPAEIKAAEIAALQSRISGHADTVKSIKDAHSGEKASVWKNAEGNFNSARLLSDSIAGAALGTVGGLVVNKIVRKNQLESGFEDIYCMVDKDRIAGFDDTVTISGGRDKAGCVGNNGRFGNIFVWAAKNGDGTNYNKMVEDVNDPENNACWVRVDVKSDNPKVSVADIKPRWFVTDSSITCGSWADKGGLQKKILASKKSARTWATVGGAVGGAGVGVGAMELFGNKAIGGKVQGQKSLSGDELLHSQMTESERVQYKDASDGLTSLCKDLKEKGGTSSYCK